MCRDVTARLDSGPEKGETTTLDITESPDQPTLREGDRIVLGRAADPGQPVAYFFSDFQRRTPLLALGLLFAVAVVGLARWRGLAALLGLGVSLLVLVRFVLPAILAGESALAAVGGRGGGDRPGDHLPGPRGVGPDDHRGAGHAGRPGPDRRRWRWSSWRSPS